MWPAATKILKELGMGSPESADVNSVHLVDFWRRKTYPVHLVRMAKVDKNQKDSKLVRSSAVATAHEVILTKVDMDAVVEGEGEPFQLVGRKALMSSLLPLLREGTVRRSSRVVGAEQTFTPREQAASVYVTKIGDAAGVCSPVEKRLCRVLVGADGIHSVCRREVSVAATTVADGDGHYTLPSAATPTSSPRFGGEVCYRGVLDLKEGSAAAAAGLRRLFEEKEKQWPGSMGVVYGDRIRFSWGYLDGSRETGYWFVKQLTEKDSSGVQDSSGQSPREKLGEAWPEPLRTFARLTGDGCMYAHRIMDRPPLAR